MPLRPKLRDVRRALLAAAIALLAAPAAAATVGIDDVVLDMGIGKYVIKHMDVTDSTLNADEIKALFTGKATGSLVEQFAKFSAKSIVIPEMQFDQSYGPISQSLVYRDGKITDIVNGVVGQIDFGSATLTAKMPDGKPMGAVMRGIHASKLDLAAGARMVTEAATSSDMPLQPLYSATSIDSYTITLPNLDISMGPATARDLKGRPLTIPLVELFKKLPVPPKDGEKPSLEEMKTLTDFMSGILDVYAAFAIGGMELNDLKVNFTGDPAGGVDPVTFLMKRVSLTDLADANLGDLTVEGIDIKSAKGSAHLGKYQLSRFDFKPMLASIAAMMKYLPQLEDQQKGAPPPPEFLKAILDVYTNYSLGKLEISDLGFEIPEDPATGKPVSIAMARFAITDIAKARIGDIALQGVDVRAPQGKLRLGNWSLRGLDYREFLSGIGDYVTSITSMTPGPDGQIAPPDMTKLKMPRLDEMRIDGIDVDTLTPPDAATPEAAPTPVKFSLGAFSIRPGYHASGLPSALAMTADHLKFVFPPDKPEFEMARAAGINDVDLSSKIDAGWNEATQQLKIGEFALSGEGLGKVFVSGTLDNVPREAFIGDEFVRQAAMLGVILTSAEVRVENSTLFQKVLAMQAKQAGQSEAEMKSALIAGAAVGIPTLLGNSPAARTLANAIAKFLADPRTLIVKASAKDGVGAGDIAAPDKILDKVDLTATANE